MATRNQSNFHQLLKRYTSGAANEEEKKFLENYYDAFEEEEDLITESNEKDHAGLKKQMRRHIQRSIQPRPVRRLRWIWYSVAASVFILLSIALFTHQKQNKEETLSQAKTEVQPGSDKATLELSGGEKIILNEVKQGKIALENGAEISKDKDGRIIYRVAESTTNTGERAKENTISTPRGGEFQVILADGTKVWLNAASSLTFPAMFSEDERTVSLFGEAYFEVSRDSKRPFRVRSEKHIVEVLGTHFNINAYADEVSIKTTLLEGAVKVSSGTGSKLISPGEQSVFNKEQRQIRVKPVNTESEIAWKNGIFSFENNNIHYILRQISRWYNIEVVYQGKIPDDTYIGEISRKTSLAEVLQILEMNNLDFQLKAHTLYVSHHQN